MAKINIQPVPKYKPRRYSLDAYRNVRNERMERALAQTPNSFTLGLRLVLEREGCLKPQHSSMKTSVFQYSMEHMRWENVDAVQWNCTVDCSVIALDAHHVGLDQTVVRQLMDVTLAPGATITFDVGNIHLGDDVTSLLSIPHEDYVISEEMDPIDWQQELTKSLTKKARRRRKS